MNYEEISKLANVIYPNKMGGLKQNEVERYRSGFIKGFQIAYENRFTKEQIIIASKLAETNLRDAEYICDFLEKAVLLENFKCDNPHCENGKIEMPYNEFISCSVCEDLRLIK